MGDREGDLEGDLENLTGDFVDSGLPASSLGFFDEAGPDLEEAGPALALFIEAGPGF